ncbi:hypothetical protein V5799_004714 [Amblyomma americanum]|uniref:Glycerol-3-phosphate dehydrogenase NAD-dependent C-terminal domain-containing protein n=1 Tax=Amblyomma americanum TaxID=6943 RepID=A0AAQ4D5C1_AMBAM
MLWIFFFFSGTNENSLGAHILISFPAFPFQSIEELEAELLNGQKLQGPETAEEVHVMLKEKNMLDRFPLFVAIHRICKREIPPSEMIQCIKNHPEHMNPDFDIPSHL